MQDFQYFFCKQLISWLQKIQMEVEEATPEEMLAYVQANPHTVTVNVEDAGPGLVLYNVATKKDKDDAVYRNHFCRLSLRRGLTYIEVLKEFKRQSLQVARKGLRKFFDLYRQYLEEEGKMAGKREAFQARLKPYKEGFTLHYIEKANGQNAQISYSHGLWVVCSKNRVMFVKSQDELEKKDKSRFYFTIEIARRWFDYFNKLSEDEQKSLTQALQSLTLIGQYCDSIRHQHIVKYEQIKIRFFAIVEKNSHEQCLAPRESFEFFKKYKLDTCKIESIDYEDKEEMQEQLKEKMRVINKTSLQQSGEGCVIYIQGKTKTESKVISLWKVKSVEYRILRKLREKLSAFLKKDRKTQKLYKKYVQQIKELASVYQPKQPLQYYIDLGKKAFQLMEDADRSVLRYIMNRYLDFLDFLAKNGTKEELWKKAKAAGSQINEDEGSDEEEESKNQQVRQQKPKQNPEPIIPKKKQIIVLVPLTIPSSGKSFVFNKLKDSLTGIRVQILSSDKVRQEVMQELKLKNKKLSHEQLFDKSAKGAKDLFFTKLNRTLTDLEHSPQQKCLFLIDKNHPQNALPSTIKEIRNIIGKSGKIVALLPECKSKIQRKGKFSYPFSKQYIYTCILRVINREQHETLMGDKLKKSNIVLSFANMFRNFRYTGYGLSKYFDGKLEVRLHNEQMEEDEELYGLLVDTLMTCKPGSFDMSKNLSGFVDMLQERKKLNQINVEQLVKINAERIIKLFNEYETMGFQEEQNDKLKQ